jgi:hypothetical protein
LHVRLIIIIVNLILDGRILPIIITPINIIKGRAIQGEFSMTHEPLNPVIKAIIVTDVINKIIRIKKRNGQADQEIITIVRSKLTIK